MNTTSDTWAAIQKQGVQRMQVLEVNFFIFLKLNGFALLLTRVTMHGLCLLLTASGNLF